MTALPLHESACSHPRARRHSGGIRDYSLLTFFFSPPLPPLPFSSHNGVAFRWSSAWANVQVVEYEDSAFFQEADSFDPCGGHATPTGNYHYHGTPGCLQEQAGGAAGQHSPLLGWAMVSTDVCARCVGYSYSMWMRVSAFEVEDGTS